LISDIKYNTVLGSTICQITKYYCCKLQYTSSYPTITNVKQLLKLSNINHTDPPLTDSTRNAKISRNVLVTLRSVRMIILWQNNGINGTFCELSVGLIIHYGITQR